MGDFMWEEFMKQIKGEQGLEEEDGARCRLAVPQGWSLPTSPEHGALWTLTGVLWGFLWTPCFPQNTENLGKASEEGHRVGESTGDSAQ